MCIAGVDEAGRGALAGPVVAAAVIFTKDTPKNLFKDSKTLSESKREELFDIITKTCMVSIGSKSHHTIDKINILNATLQAMKDAIIHLPEKPTKVLIDGNKTPTLPNYTLESIVKGDAKIPEISAASIIAKVTRDRIMRKCHSFFPSYQFEINKGYGTAPHYNAIFTHGISPLHRRSFNLTKQETLF